MEKRDDAAARVTRATDTARATAYENPNLAERLVAQLGAWAVTMAERLNPPTGPFFHSDGRLLADATLFAPCDASCDESCAP